MKAAADFLLGKDCGVPSIAAVQPLHVAAWIEGQTRERSAPTVKQQLAAIRHLFDWLMIGQVMPLNPAASLRGRRTACVAVGCRCYVLSSCPDSPVVLGQAVRLHWAKAVKVPPAKSVE